MKVLVVGQDWFGKNVQCLTNAFKKNGHEVVSYFYSKPRDYSFSPKTKQKTSSAFFRKTKAFLTEIRSDLEYHRRSNAGLLEAARIQEPNFVFIVKGQNILPDTIRSLRRRGVKVFLWWYDQPFEYFKQFPSLIETLRVSDHVFLIDHQWIHALRLAGVAHCSYLGHGFDEAVYGPNVSSTSTHLDTAKKTELSFVGTCYPERALFFSEISDFPIRIFGPNWTDLRLRLQGRSHNIDVVETFVNQRDQRYIFLNSRININLHRPLLISAYNQRFYEMAACGAFQIVEARFGSNPEFIENSELVSFFSLKDFRDKVNYFKKNYKEANDIAQAAQEKCLRQYSMATRLQEALDSWSLN